ncbi:MAG: metal-dependent hydrolase [Flavobacteriales bacterium]|nr:metal-dependent hydrolase [Flavobacteriales bacterium]
MNITYYGHSCFLVEIRDIKLLFDPFITPNPLAKHINIDQIEAHYILVSHGHEDHVADALSIAKRTGATVVSNFEIATWFSSQGITAYHPMNFGGRKTFDFGTVQYVAAIHSSVLPDGTYGGNPGGFVVETGGDDFYYSGDTALTMDMKLYGEGRTLKTTFLPIGDNFTMGIDDALRCAEFVGCSSIVGLHYDTFPYIVIDKEVAQKKAKAKQIDLHLPGIGDTIKL